MKKKTNLCIGYTQLVKVYDHVFTENIKYLKERDKIIIKDIKYLKNKIMCL